MTMPTVSAPPARTARLMRRATHASVIIAATLIALKFGAWLATDSVAVLSSLVDSMLDAIASLINFVAVRHALAPADREHRFGHGKAESLAGLGQAAFVAGSAMFLVFEATARLFRPHEIAHGEAGIAVMAVSIVLTLGLVRYQLYVVRETRSVAIAADSIHYKADILVNVGIIISLVLTGRFGLGLADPLMAYAVAAYILYSAGQVARKALDSLMDREMSDEDRDRIKTIVGAHQQVRGLHDLRTRMAGIRPFIQLHLELDGAMTLDDAHIASDQVEVDLLAAFPGAEIIIHQDPEGLFENTPSFSR
ncbi:MAG: cation diffusion facilitator family transporter [Alphaproteobacteria bacterium]|jgi:ferrous-iron efflux pump FieF|nr:cation diffusion facilitator family transporter [Alphaproteobacteria bacterium]MDP6515232.1 cation diffusion facilitator family transporter [Alphaproteobacteria bacterium]